MPFIYKITNIKNQKIYVGQTRENSIQKRFNRHIYDAMTKSTNSEFAKAIRQYGKDSFKIELLEEVDEEILNEKEIFWISELKSTIKDGNYNTANGGGYYYNKDIYRYKTEEQIESLKDVMRGGNNHNATAIDAKDYETNKEYRFNSVVECMSFFNLPNKEVVIHRCSGKTTSLYKRRYAFKYATSEEYIVKSIAGTYNRSLKCKVNEIGSNEEFIFESVLDFARHYNLNNIVKIHTERHEKNKPFKYTHRPTKRKFIMTLLE